MEEASEERVVALEKAVCSLGELLMFITDESDRQANDERMEENLRRMAEMRAKAVENRGRRAELREQMASALAVIPKSGTRL
ncbi:MAG TPA: hypothetical protein VFV02_09445 [Acidimicrobiales bacterium]|nr:hypothetical protein [Acidimicrobiales bacterium]